MLDAYALISYMKLALWWVQINFDPMQEIVPKVECGRSFEGGHSTVYVYKHN